ncbi:MAG TPA: hypothetical protein VM029_19720 [Opitutaceae bacterium]|nr:hypothetical protein [Opitutaceae bacterium]
MKNILISALRAALLTACVGAPAFVSAAPAADRAADVLARDGTLAAATAGRFVEVGTYRVQVAAKLGRPDLILQDGTWLYRGRKVEDSSAQGTLVVRFANGRVTSLALATPAVVAALRADPRARGTQELVAAK